MTILHLARKYHHRGKNIIWSDREMSCNIICNTQNIVKNNSIRYKLKKIYLANRHHYWMSLAMWSPNIKGVNELEVWVQNYCLPFSPIPLIFHSAIVHFWGHPMAYLFEQCKPRLFFDCETNIFIICLLLLPQYYTTWGACSSLWPLQM